MWNYDLKLTGEWWLYAIIVQVVHVPDAKALKHSECRRFPLNRPAFHSVWCNNSIMMLAFIMYRHMHSQAPLTRLIINTSCAEPLSCTVCLLCPRLRRLWKQEPRNLPFERHSCWGNGRDEYYRQHICKEERWRPLNWKPWFSFSFLHFKKVSTVYKLKRFPLSFQVIFALKYNYCNCISVKLNSSFRCLFTKPRRTKLDNTFYVMLHVECDLFVTILSLWVWRLRRVCLFSPCLHWVSPLSSNNPKICMLD